MELEPRGKRRLGTVASFAGFQKRGDALDEHDGDVHPPQRADDGDGDEEREPPPVADDHRVAPVEPVRDDTGERAQDNGRNDAQDEDARDGEVLAHAVGGELGGESGRGEQGEPVAEAGDGPSREEVAEPAGSRGAA